MTAQGPARGTRATRPATHASLAAALADDQGAVPRGLDGDALLWRALVRDAPIGIFQLDTALRYVTVNPALAALNGVPAEEHVGRTMAEVVPDLAPGLEPLARRVLSGEAVRGVEVTGETVAAPGAERCWLISYSPLRPDGRDIVGVAGVVMEITERKRAARRSSRLLDVAVALGRALRVTDVAEVVTQACAAEVSTMTAGIVLYDEVRDSLRFVTMVGYPPSIVDGWREFPADADIAITQALRTGQPVYEPRVRDYLRRHPQVAADTVAAGVGATASLPLVVAGRRVGVLALAWHDDHEFDAEEREFLETLAGQAAQALERARLFERGASMSEMLQRSLLPDWLPDLPGVTIGALYLPAGDGSEVGGDFYDVFRLPDGRVLAALGDVTGKGVSAARVMGRVRHGLRGIALATQAPAGELLDALDDLLASYSDDRLVTVVIAIIDMAKHRVEVASAGHLPPLVLTREGATEFLEVGGSHPLGLPIARLLPGGPANRSQATVPVPPGSTLMLYSDGLVETRRTGLDVGLPRLQAAVAAVPRAGRCDPQLLCERLSTALLPDHREDDVAVLAVQLDQA